MAKEQEFAIEQKYCG